MIFEYMKKLLLILSALVIVFTAGAQNKEAVLKNLEKAKLTTENPKKAVAPATWMKLSDAYMSAYRFPQSGLWIGASSMDTKLLLKDSKVLSSQVKNLSGTDFTIESYEDKDLYFNPQGILEVILVTVPVTNEDCLEGAYSSLMKAYEVDTKGAKKEDIANQLQFVKEAYINEAMGYYTIGDIKSANHYFESSLKVSDNPCVGKVDSLITFYTAVTFNMLGDNDNAIKYFNICKDLGYDQKGDVYSSLAEIYKAKGEIESAKSILNEGFRKYPTSQGVLVSLINIYLESKDDPNKVLNLIRTAQENEPTNPSLYYAEGNVYKNLNDFDNAIKCYYKSFEIDPSYVFGIYSVGTSYYDRAIELQTKMNELDLKDVATYDKLFAEFEDCLLNAADPFEKAFNATSDMEFQVVIADGLKQIYYRFRDKDPRYQAGYEKYSKFLEENQTPSNEK